MSRVVSSIRINERGEEAHESWLLVSASRLSGGAAELFDSEIRHHSFVQVTVSRATRRRELKHDYLYDESVLMKFDMSMAQWGAFVSSFGHGSGVPATLSWLNGPVARAPFESRLGESVNEVRGAGEEALTEIQRAYEQVAEAFESGGRKALREAIRTLGIRLENAPKNMAFAAESLTEHVENVVTKARADLEAMVEAAMERGELTESVVPLLPEATERDPRASLADHERPGDRG